MGKKIIVIGSGFGGLGAACRLAARGHEVEIFEKRDKLGGRAYVYDINGFKFDGGPTLVTAPFMFDDIFTAAGRRREDYVQFVPCEPFYQIIDHQKCIFQYNNDIEFVKKQIDAINPADKEGYVRFLESTKPIFQKGFVELADQPFLRIGDMLKVAPDLVKMQSYKSVYAYVSQFVKSDLLRQALSFHPLLVGGNPFDAPSIYAMINYLMDNWGVFYAIGGTGAIVQALGKLFGELCGRVHLNAEVEEILVEGRKAVGVRLADGTIHRADIVVSNADVAWTYMNLLKNQKRRWNSDLRLKAMRYSMSLFVIYFGTRRRYPDQGLVHHNIILSKRYKALLDDIFSRKVLADDFSLYLHMPTYTDPSIAPPGTESFYVLSPVPNLAAKDIDWQRVAPEYKNRILGFLEENFLPDLRANIIAEHYIDPLHFQNTLNSYLGAGFSLEPVMTQSAWFRPHNRSEDFDNLYFVGAGTHPGAGIPGVLASAIIAENLIQEAG